MTEFNFGIFKKFQTAMIQGLLLSRSQGTATAIQRKQQNCNWLKTQGVKSLGFLDDIAVLENSVELAWQARLAGQFRGTVGPPPQ
jgi:hypothetical protein